MINRIDKTRKNPYTQKPFIKCELKIEPEDLDTVGIIKSTITGEFGNRKAYISTGYEGHEDTMTNYYLLSEQELRMFIGQLKDILGEIKQDKDDKEKESELLKELHNYISKGYIKSITLRKLDISIRGFNSVLYKVFNVEPEFEYSLPNDNINLGFNFVKVFRFPIKKEDYEAELRALTNGKDIPIKFIGFDRDEQIKDYIKDAKDSLKSYDPSKRKPPTKEDVSKVLKVFSDLQ